MSDFDETWWSCSTYVYYNFTKFHQNQMKNKKVLLIARFSVQNFKVSVELWKSYIVLCEDTSLVCNIITKSSKCYPCITNAYCHAWICVKEDPINYYFRLTVGQKTKKKSRQKNSWNQINLFHNFFLPKSIFCNFKNFWTEKIFTTAKYAI